MSENFTKGPWQKRGFGIYLPNTQKRVCEVPLAWKTSTEQAAVMDLIVAAPDLLSALEGMVDRWEPDCIGTDRIMWENARAAIAKARGDASADRPAP